ncbi:methyltransferase, partial [bacterium]|nr:methyltransferase [bacterium]
MRGVQPSFQGPIRLDASFDAELFRRVLDEKGYTQAAITETLDLGHSEGSFVKATDRHSILKRTSESSEYHTLVRLFVLARTVPEDEASAALGPFPLSALENLGFLEKVPGGVRSPVLLMPHEGMLIVFDFWPQITGEAMRDDFVLGIGPASMALGYLTVRREAGRTLDLGTGCGIQALMAARHSREVVATDINVRALNLAALNARLNGLSHIELREGSLFDPVRD